MKIGFRLDADDQIGFGHFFRAFAIASSIRDLGHNVALITGSASQWVRDLADAESIAVVALENGGTFESGIDDPNPFSGSADDATQTVATAKRLELDLLIFDHYGIGQEWVDQVKSSGLELMQIADHRALTGILWVLDYGFDASLEKHGLESQSATKTMLGPVYAPLANKPLDPQAAEYFQKKLRKPLVLVALGSGVPASLLDGLADAYRTSSKSFDLCIVSNKKLENERFEPGITWLRQVRGLAGLLSLASFAVTSAGVTMYERISSGVPGVAVKTADNQSAAFSQLKDDGLGTDALLELDDLVVDQLFELIENSLQEDTSEQRCLLQSKLDWTGSMRVALALTDCYDKSLITMRHHEPRDASLLLRWANDPYARAMSLNSSEILPAEHLAWLSKCELQKVQILIFEYRGVPCAQVRFEPKGTGTVISYMLDQVFRGKGLSGPIIEMALKTAHIGSEVTALVKSSNSQSRLVLERHGFLPDSIEDSHVVLKRRGF